ncbi:MAG TPA: glycosyltransferase family 39 protein [Gaiellaceae bacterium]|jgi:4-amino-4-deoxy-L-arabinose transferase-like glycosyltransferase
MRLRKSESKWGGPGRGLAAILALAAALRVVGLQYGLPFGLLNPDEQSIVPRAWKIVHGGGLDPHWFDYPTLVMYLIAPFQAWQGGPSYLAARSVVVVLALAGIAAAWWLGRQAYGPVAGVVAAAFTAVEATHVAYSHMAVTDVPLAAGVAACLALCVSGRLEWAGVAAGLATSAKYPGVFLVVPIVVAGWRRWNRVAVSLALAAAAFLATSPFVAVHPLQAWHAAIRVQRLAHAGWLGFEHDHATPVAFAARLWQGAGPALLVAALGLALALWRRSRTDLVLASFVLVYALDLLTIRAHFDRYVLPLVPPLGAFAGRVRYLAPVTLLLLVVPLAWSIRDDRRLTRTDPRVTAYHWIERNLPRGAWVATDSSLPSLAGFRELPLQLPGPGRPHDPNRDVARLRALGVRFVVVTGAVEDRVLAARDRYPQEARFVEALPGPPIYRTPAGTPWVAVYRL